MKMPKIHLMSFVATIFILLITTPQVSGQYMGGMGTTWNNPISASASSILSSRLGQRSYPSSANGKRETVSNGSQRTSSETVLLKVTADQMNRAVRFRSVGNHIALETVVNGFGNNSAGQKEWLRTVFTKLLDNYNAETAKNGYANDLALAYSTFIAMNSAVYHEEELAPDTKIMQLRDRVAEIAVRDKLFSQADNSQKQVMYETLIMIGSFTYAGYVNAKQKGARDEIKVFKQLAGECFKKVVGLSPDEFRFTKESLDGAANKTRN